MQNERGLPRSAPVTSCRSAPGKASSEPGSPFRASWRQCEPSAREGGKRTSPLAERKKLDGPQRPRARLLILPRCGARPLMRQAGAMSWRQRRGLQDGDLADRCLFLAFSESSTGTAWLLPRFSL